MIFEVFKVWPLLLICYSIATMFGIFVWFTDQFKNPAEFHVGDSLKGPLIGFWFSFVTMTTVGYGDVTPRSFIGKLVSIVWILMGLVLNGIIISFITAAVTTINIPTEYGLHNTKVSVLSNSFEKRYVVGKSAVLNNENVYGTVPAVLSAVEQQAVEMAVIDTYSLAEHVHLIAEKQLKVVKIKNVNTGFGFVLSGLSTVLKYDLESLLLSKSPFISKFIADMKDTVPSVDEGSAGEASADIFSKDAKAFQISCLYMMIMILIGACLGLTFNLVQWIRRRAKVQPEVSLRDMLSIMIREHRDNLNEITDELADKHMAEITKLALLKKYYKDKITVKGRYDIDEWIFTLAKEKNDKNQKNSEKQ